MTSVKRDLQRFKKIVRGQVRKNLKKYLTDDSLVGRKGKDVVSIPVPQIRLPYFRFGDNRGGAGQGQGGEGTVIGRRKEEGKKRGEEGGDTPGRHFIEVEISLEELAELLGEELELPRIQPKQRAQTLGEVRRYSSSRRVGPESLRYMKRTYVQALKRSIILGIFDPKNPSIVPIRDDKRYRSWKDYPYPENNAVIFHIMDVSGSMFSSKKRLVRLMAFWIDLWIKHHYENVIVVYIVHDMQAIEVDYDTFFSMTVDGGTHISSGYELCNKIMEERYSPNDWNIYVFHYSDGENFGYDNQPAVEALRIIQQKANLFCYGEVHTVAPWYSSDDYSFISQIRGLVKETEAENIVTAKVVGEDKILDAIKDFLGKGR